MARRRGKSLLPAALAASAIASAALAGEIADTSASETDPPFGGEANVAYAEALWQALAERNLVGEDGIATYTYEGTQPHGLVLELLSANLTFEDHTGPVIVKRNYVGEAEPGELRKQVLADRMQYLDSVTVMFQRADGYDPEFDNWFWAKYAADGSLSENPKGMKLAGRVAKGAGEGGAHGGCIGCHVGAPGEDLIFTEGLTVE